MAAPLPRDTPAIIGGHTRRTETPGNGAANAKIQSVDITHNNDDNTTHSSVRGPLSTGRLSHILLSTQSFFRTGNRSLLQRYRYGGGKSASARDTADAFGIDVRTPVRCTNVLNFPAVVSTNRNTKRLGRLLLPPAQTNVVNCDCVVLFTRPVDQRRVRRTPPR